MVAKDDPIQINDQQVHGLEAPLAQAFQFFFARLDRFPAHARPRHPHRYRPDAVARRSLALTAVTPPRSAPAPARRSIRPAPASIARSTPPSAAKLVRSWPETSPTPGSLPCLRCDMVSPRRFSFSQIFTTRF